jgi:hypothetical protein
MKNIIEKIAEAPAIILDKTVIKEYFSLIE